MRIYQRYGQQSGRDQAGPRAFGLKCGRDRASSPRSNNGSHRHILRGIMRPPGPCAGAEFESHCGINSSNFAQLQPKYGFVAGLDATYACSIDAFQKNICFVLGSCHSDAAVLPHSPGRSQSRGLRFHKNRPDQGIRRLTCPNGQVACDIFRQGGNFGITVSNRATKAPLSSHLALRQVALSEAGYHH